LFTAFWLEVLNPDANVLLVDPLTVADAVMNKVPAGAQNPESYPYWRTRVVPLMGDPLEEHILTSVSALSLLAERERAWTWWAHTGGGNALAFKNRPE
jgi:hypothetical protein